MEESNNVIIPSILLFAAVVELGITPLVIGKIKGPQKLIVGGAMVMGSIVTALLGVAFWIPEGNAVAWGWIG